jgi:protein-S-isoprenylcysteine O-methyltransferase Ste14
MEQLFVAVRTAIYMSGFVLLWGWAAFSVERYDRQLHLALPPGTAFIGAALFVLGGLLAVVCAGTFVVVGRGTPAPFDAPRAFVAAGPFRWTRNPMYVGALILLLGLGLLRRSPSILVLAGAAFLIAHLFVVLVEEPGLEERFGGSYLAYKKTTNRWIPRVPRAA